MLNARLGIDWLLGNRACVESLNSVSVISNRARVCVISKMVNVNVVVGCCGPRRPYL